MKTISLKQVLTPISVFAANLLLLLVFSLVGAGTVGAVDRCDGLPSQDRGVCLADPDAWSRSQGNALLNIIPVVINILSVIVGVIAVIMVIVGGLKYITSSGEPGNVTSAKNTILYAVIGLVVVALAQIIVRFVLSEVGDVTN